MQKTCLVFIVVGPGYAKKQDRCDIFAVPDRSDLSKEDVEGGVEGGVSGRVSTGTHLELW